MFQFRLLTLMEQQADRFVLVALIGPAFAARGAVSLSARTTPVLNAKQFLTLAVLHPIAADAQGVGGDLQGAILKLAADLGAVE